MNKKFQGVHVMVKNIVISQKISFKKIIYGMLLIAGLTVQNISVAKPTYAQCKHTMQVNIDRLYGKNPWLTTPRYFSTSQKVLDKYVQYVDRECKTDRIVDIKIEKFFQDRGFGETHSMIWMAIR